MRALRYAVVGGLAFLIDFSLLLLLWQVLPLLLANTIAFLVANGVNFWLGHVWVFRRTMKDGETASIYLSVLLVSLVGLALNDIIVWTGIVVMEAGVVPVKIGATLAAWCWNYWMRTIGIYGR